MMLEMLDNQKQLKAMMKVCTCWIEVMKVLIMIIVGHIGKPRVVPHWRS